MSPSDVALEYFGCMRARDSDRIADLFSGDAKVRVFNGTIRDGREAIHDWFATSAMANIARQNPTLVRMMTRG